MKKTSAAVHSEVTGVVADGKLGTWQQYDLTTEKNEFLRECDLLEHRDGADFDGIICLPDLSFSDMLSMALSKAGIGPFDRVREVLTGERKGLFMENLRFVADEIEKVRSWRRQLLEEVDEYFDEKPYTAITEEYNKTLDALIQLFQTALVRELSGTAQKDMWAYYRKTMGGRPYNFVPPLR